MAGKSFRIMDKNMLAAEQKKINQLFHSQTFYLAWLACLEKDPTKLRQTQLIRRASPAVKSSFFLFHSAKNIAKLMYPNTSDHMLTHRTTL